jgi:hypothetical protein
MADYNVITVDSGNVEELGFFCVKNKKHPGYIAKLSWLQQRFEEGMRIKLILTIDGKQAGFLEYIPGEYTWRVINAPGYLVIHCIWVNSNQFPYGMINLVYNGQLLADHPISATRFKNILQRELKLEVGK